MSIFHESIQNTSHKIQQISKIFTSSTQQRTITRQPNTTTLRYTTIQDNNKIKPCGNYSLRRNRFIIMIGLGMMLDASITILRQKIPISASVSTSLAWIRHWIFTTTRCMFGSKKRRTIHNQVHILLWYFI